MQTGRGEEMGTEYLVYTPLSTSDSQQHRGRDIAFFGLMAVMSILALLYLAYSPSLDDWFYSFMATAFFSALLVLSLYGLALSSGAVKAENPVEATRNLVESITEEAVVFRRPVRYWIGYIEVVGYYSTYRNYRGIARSRYDSMKREIKVREGEGDRIPLDRQLLSNYLVLVAPNGEGYIRLPAVRIMERKTRNVLIAFIPQIREYTPQETTIKVSSRSGDEGKAVVRIEGNKITGELHYTSKKKSRALRLELVTQYEQIPVFKSWKTPVSRRLEKAKTIAETRTPGIARIDYSLDPPKPVAIIVEESPNKLSLIKVLDPEYVKRVLEELKIHTGGTLVYGYAKAKNQLRLVLDIPLHEDIAARKNIEIKPKH